MVRDQELHATALPIPGFKAPERHHPRKRAGCDPLHADAHAFVKRLPRLPPVRSSRTDANMFDGAISHALLRDRQEQHGTPSCF